MKTALLKGRHIKTELIAGFTTFITMAYILAVNPIILSQAGMDKEAVFAATALSAGIASLIMGGWARLPYALAPGMGMNALFTFTVVMGMGKTWEFALTAVFLEGIIFVLLTVFNIRKAVIQSLPLPLRQILSAGIGLFIAFIGLSNAGIIVKGEGTLLHLGRFTNPSVIIGLTGLLVIGILHSYRVKGSLLLGILAAAVLGIPLGVTDLSGINFQFRIPSLSPTIAHFAWDQIFSTDMLFVITLFLFVDIFDTIGTLYGVAARSGHLDRDGEVVRVKRAFTADAIGTMIGGFLGTSPVTTYIESAAGIEEGGRTGLTAIFTGILFLLSIFLAPLFLLVPAAATASCLVIVGLFMFEGIKNIDFRDYTEAIPAFLVMILIPFSYSISNGIIVGLVSYCVLKIFSKKRKDLKISTLVVSLIFGSFFFFMNR